MLTSIFLILVRINLLMKFFFVKFYNNLYRKMSITEIQDSGGGVLNNKFI